MNSTTQGNNTAMRNAFIAALKPGHKHNRNAVYRAIKGQAGTRTRFMQR